MNAELPLQNENRAVILTEDDLAVANMRTALVAFYEDRAAMYRAIMEDAELMGRTVQYLDDEGVALEYGNKCGAQEVVALQAEVRRLEAELSARNEDRKADAALVEQCHERAERLEAERDRAWRRVQAIAAEAEGYVSLIRHLPGHDDEPLKERVETVATSISTLQAEIDRLKRNATVDDLAFTSANHLAADADSRLSTLVAGVQQLEQWAKERSGQAQTIGTRLTLTECANRLTALRIAAAGEKA